MRSTKFLKAVLIGGVSAIALASSALADEFNIPAGDLSTALDAYTKQTGADLIISGDTLRGTHTRGVKGEMAADIALARILDGTGFAAKHTPNGAIGLVREGRSRAANADKLADATPVRAATSVETVVVTSSKIKGDIQTVPIAITALSQEQLTSRQIAGGPDLVKEVPNLTFTKTNFTGYNIQIRGIGTQAISVTTDPAVAVAFNDTPFIRNHFFEQEFYDVSQVEVLRGPQGTLYGRNATAGVVNVISAKPTDKWEAMASVDVGNYQNRRSEAMLNIPIVDDRLDLRVAGEWTKRDGYSFNETTGKPIDGRDLWSSRVTIGFHPIERLQAYAVWEHFQEDDDRMRTAKQLCKKDPGPTSVGGLDITNLGPDSSGSVDRGAMDRAWLSQGCLPTSLYSPEAFETPNGQAIPFIAAAEFALQFTPGTSDPRSRFLLNEVDPYADKVQPRDLRVIQSDISPTYKAKNDVFELNADFNITPSLTLTSQTGYNKDFLHSTEDFNRFNTAPGLFNPNFGYPFYDGTNNYVPIIAPNGIYCDPQLGCSTKMVGEDLSRESAWQFSQELRLASNLSGPFNFSLGGNYMHYQTKEDYFVFFNVLSALVQLENKSGPGDWLYAHTNPPGTPDDTPMLIPPTPVYGTDLNGDPVGIPSNFSAAQRIGAGGASGNTYIDPNPIGSVNGLGHNYFRSENPYRLNSFAGFGEAYYQVAPDLKLTGGLRWTDDRKTFFNIPSWVFMLGGGYPVVGIVKQEWKEFTGRFVSNWTPKLDFTDATMFYASYARGYKGGGANPPGPEAELTSGQSLATHPATFAPEFVNAFELGTKNTLLDGSMTFNADVFYYDYKGYQISQIVDRTSINLNFDAKVDGAEVEATWEPVPGLSFNLAGGFENSSVNKGQSAIDLMDRTAGNTDWMVVKPFITDTSNCVLPTYVVKTLVQYPGPIGGAFSPIVLACELAYSDIPLGNPFLPSHSDPGAFYGIPTGFDPSTAPNNGAGFAKDLSGNKLPNTPPFTLSFGAQYSMPVSEDWAATLRGDLYWQGNSYARIFNDRPYDKLRGYSTTNLALVFTNADGWQVMGYVKNVFDKTAITGAFLNSDDTALTTNVFLTDPRLFGVRITKNF